MIIDVPDRDPADLRRTRAATIRAARRVARDTLFVTRKPKRKQAKARPVVCIETGRLYPSLGEAGSAFRRTASSIRAAIDRGTPCGSRHWRFATPAEIRAYRTGAAA